jgi:hypothetical protein
LPRFGDQNKSFSIYYPNKMATENSSAHKMIFNKTRYDQLAPLFVEMKLEPAEEQEFLGLRAAKQQADQGRKTLMTNLVASLKADAVTVAELIANGYMSKDELKTEVDRVLGTKTGRAPGKGKSTRAASAPKAGVVFMVQATKGQPERRGAGVGIIKNELPAKFGPKLAWLKKQDGDLTANLMKMAAKTPEADEYLASPEGKKFVTRVVEFIRAGK